MRNLLSLAALAAAILASATTRSFAATPAPSGSHGAPPGSVPGGGAHGLSAAHLPTVPLHTEVVVEVNKKGQVVRVKSTKPSKMQGFNLETYGNALQMWIRKPDGTAEVGLYRVIYDFDPKTKKVTRRIALVSLGGNWGDDPGAANVMMDMAKKQAAEARQQAKAHNTQLPSLNEIRGAPTPSPAHNATLPP
jgi:hypothetical protein